MTSKLIFAAALALSLAGVATARPQQQVFVAKVEQPYSERTRVVAERAVWQCEGDTCTAVVSHAPTTRACRELAREVGRVTEYGPEAGKLPAEQLAACNASARARA